MSKKNVRIEEIDDKDKEDHDDEYDDVEHINKKAKTNNNNKKNTSSNNINNNTNDNIPSYIPLKLDGTKPTVFVKNKETNEVIYEPPRIQIPHTPYQNNTISNSDPNKYKNWLLFITKVEEELLNINNIDKLNK
jgi:hypothetical protein